MIPTAEQVSDEEKVDWIKVGDVWVSPEFAALQSGIAARFEELMNPPRAAAIGGGGGNPYHCPAGTGITSGRFTNAQSTTCNPTTEQLSITGLQTRKAQLDKALAGDLSTERRTRLEEEVRLVEVESKRRSSPGQPEGLGETTLVEEPDEVVVPDSRVDLSTINPEGRKMRVEVWGDVERTELSEKAVRRRIEAITDAVAEEFDAEAPSFKMFRTQADFEDAIISHRMERYGGALRAGNSDAQRIMDRPFPEAQWNGEFIALSPKVVADIGAGGLTALRIVHHEAMHSIDGRKSGGWTHIGPDLTFVEGATEILSMEHYGRTFQPPTKNRVSYFDESGERVYETDPIRKMTRRMAYPERVAEVLANVIHQVGPDQGLVLNEIRSRYSSGDDKVRDSFFDVFEERKPYRLRPNDDAAWDRFQADFPEIRLDSVPNFPEPPSSDPSAYDNGDDGWYRDVERSASLMDWLLTVTPKTAGLGGGNPYHCPAGTGITSGRFTNAQSTTCNPTTEQLSITGLQTRKAQLDKALAGDLSTERRTRLEEEVRLVEVESKRRSSPGQPEGLGVTVEPNEVAIQQVDTPEVVGEQLELGGMEYTEPVPIEQIHMDADTALSRMREVQTPFGVVPDHSAIVEWAKERQALHDRLMSGTSPSIPSLEQMDAIQDHLNAMAKERGESWNGMQFGKGGVASWGDLDQSLSFLSPKERATLEEAGLVPTGFVSPARGYVSDLPEYQHALDALLASDPADKRFHQKGFAVEQAANSLPRALRGSYDQDAFYNAVWGGFEDSIRVEPLSVQIPNASEIQLRAADENFKITRDLFPAIEAPKLKHLLVDQVAEHSGVEYGDVNDIVGAWATSAQYAQSGEMQAAADAAMGGKGVFTQVAMNLYDPKTYYAREVSPSVKKVLDSVYQHTQGLLRERGLEEISVMRGVKFKPTSLPQSIRDQLLALSPEDYAKGSTYATAEWDRNPLTSWTTDRHTAATFAFTTGSNQVSVTQEVVAPAAAVFSTAQTGPGALKEQEILLLDAGGPARVEIKWDPENMDQGDWAATRTERS